MLYLRGVAVRGSRWRQFKFQTTAGADVAPDPEPAYTRAIDPSADPGAILACPSCRTANPPTARFCMSCGVPLVGTVGRALDGERKQVTVLFADVVGSTELIGDLDPEEARTLLDGAVRVMMDAVRRYGGTVSQTRGDSVVALFGAPVAHEDHAVRACHAALAIQGAVRRDRPEEGIRSGGPIRVRVGLDSGEVVVRPGANDLGPEYTALGQAVYLAARIEQVAQPGAVVLSPATRALAEGYVQVRPLGLFPVLGLPEPVELSELLGSGPARTRLDAAATRGLTRFVGRDAELAALQQALDAAGSGAGQVVAVVGEPALGKSRLVRELTHSPVVRGWLVLETGAISYGSATAYLPVRELLRGYFGIEGRDAPATIREKVTARLQWLGAALESAAPALLALLDVPADDAAWLGLDPAARRRQTLDAVTRLLLRESAEQPLLVVCEDLHWLDGETQALLDGLVERLSAARILLLVNYRPEYAHGWGGIAQYRELRLGPLPPESADELLDELLGRDAAFVPLKRLLIEQTEANPLFLEESVRSLVETAAVTGERGARRLTRPVEQLTIPATVQAILAARIDRLAPLAKRVLQAAAVIGKDVPLPLLVAVADAPEPEVRARLAQFQDADLVYEVGPFPDPAYTFKHALTHEVAYQGLLRERRRALHGRVVTAIERLAGERVAEQSERLAHHAVRAELWEQAVGYLRQAGARAMARAAYREAIVHFEQAIEVLQRLPETPEMLAAQFDIHFELRSAMQPFGNWVRMGEHIRAAEALARRLGDQRRLARVVSYMASHTLAMGRFDEALALGQEALSIGQSLGDLSVEVLSTSFVGQTHNYRGELLESAANLEWIVALDGPLRYERFGAPSIQWCLAGSWLADVLAQLGRFDEAIARAAAAVEVAEEAHNQWSIFRSTIDLGRSYLRRGDLPRAIEILGRNLEHGRARNFAFGVPHAAASLGAAYGLAGRGDEAVALVAEPLAELRRRQDHSRPTLVLLGATTAYLGAGRLDEAATLAAETVALCRQLGAHGFGADALRLAGDVALAAGREDDASGHYREALALGERLGMRPIVAHCHLGLGRLAQRAGRQDEARAELSAAVALLRALGMLHWLLPAEAELAAVTRERR